MAMQISSGEEDGLTSAINTTPLVDVMLVLLIIFLITIPVVTQTVPMQLPLESNIARQTKPENIEISVNKDGDIFWNAMPVADSEALFQRLKEVATKTPQPEIHIRADKRARYEYVSDTLAVLQRGYLIAWEIEPEMASTIQRLRTLDGPATKLRGRERC